MMLSICCFTCKLIVVLYDLSALADLEINWCRVQNAIYYLGMDMIAFLDKNLP